MHSLSLLLVSSLSFTSVCLAQNTGNETRVVVPLTNSTDITVNMRDRNDLEILKHYDFQALFNDVIKRLEASDSTPSVVLTTTDTSATQPQEDSVEETAPYVWNNDHDSHDWETLQGNTTHSWNNHSVDRFRTWPYFNIELGTNNYLSDGKFPDSENALYSVRPIGSWYLAANSIQRTRVANKFFLEWGLGMSWYNFKFQDNNIRFAQNDTGVDIYADTTSAIFKKSKLSASYLNVSFVPVIDFSGEGHRPRFWDNGHSFRVGVGPYAGYRLGGHSKILYKEDGNRKKDKNTENLYLANLRYGVRLQLGFRSTDIFFNYDLNSLFSTNKGPNLNAFSFGITL